eukprot:CAMPEP_0168571224 /NCGR_PEP_ID=MMETSP0413-20121227/17220_1 /TAXON_ID=136452 /ORGANISM="Filamoeba nolandi, Strain NC-AS-23-1" /LENGTH=48 /DNA_ID= /DNA_START= /DNA_END= /DNA_ORIENTATION=
MPHLSASTPPLLFCPNSELEEVVDPVELESTEERLLVEESFASKMFFV